MDAPSDLFSKLDMAATASGRSPVRGGAGHKRKPPSDPDTAAPAAKHARGADGSKILRHNFHHNLSVAAAAAEPGGAAHQIVPEEEEIEEEEEEETGVAKRRGLPLWVWTIGDGGEQEWEATAPWNVFTKGFFHARGSDIRAGYWVYYKGHVVARALLWNDEFDEVRYEHQGYAPVMRGVDRASVSPVSVGLMAILEAIVWCRGLIAFAQWHVYVDNVDALKLVDMYQRNAQFMRFHPERPLLDLVVDAAQAGRIHLHRK